MNGNQVVGAFERRASKDLADMKEILDRHAELRNMLERTQTEAEIYLATELLPLADEMRDVRDLIARKLDDHKMVLSHEKPLRAIEKRNGSRKR